MRVAEAKLEMLLYFDGFIFFTVLRIYKYKQLDIETLEIDDRSVSKDTRIADVKKSEVLFLFKRTKPKFV